MARKARQRISYVLPLANSAGGHRLGVNGLAVDQQGSALYSAGRDGVICAWHLNFDLRNANPDKFKAPATTFHRQVQAHTHWINDICLSKQNTALVSASADTSVKVWRPAGDDALPPQTIGLHSDYVKVLASPGQDSDWVASGGLDRKILFWDLNGAGERLKIDVGLEEGASGLGRDKGSVYALAATPTIIGSGGPECAVRMWDPRSGKRITNFMGHTDNVRDILISYDGSTVMTASSDQTVKLWSVTAGRCMNTFTMHDSSVWSLWSDHPNLSVFWSSDRSGLIAKTDTRGCQELEDGLCVAVCQEHQGVHKVVAAGDYLWTATSTPSINRWQDVNTDGLEVDVPEASKQSHRLSYATTRSYRFPAPTSPNSVQSPTRTISSGEEHKLPMKHTLRLSNTAYIPRITRPVTRDTSTENVEEPELEPMQPVRDAPDSHIEGQNGLIKHSMLSDRRRVLTLDTAGEVVMWDLIKCVPIKSYGKRHIEDVLPEVNTAETVPNWCLIDTRTGSLTITLEENNAFDAEMYADELDIADTVDFKEDQRINLGKWVLRYLFANLVDVEVQRDQQIRRHLLDKAMQQKFERDNAPPNIQLPPSQSNGYHDPAATPTPATVKTPTNPVALFTPGFSIGQATPGVFSPIKTRDSAVSGSEDGAALTKTTSQQSRKSTDNKDYFSNYSNPTTALSNPVDSSKTPLTPGGENPGEENDSATALPGETPSKFGRKFKMNMSFGMRKLSRTSMSEVAAKPAPVEETLKEAEAESDSRSGKTDNSRVVDENFLGCIQKIRFGYEDDLTAQAQRQAAMESAGGALGAAKEFELPSQITPSQPSETPVIKPPANTTILIQEDSPEAGGVADLWEGKVGRTGEASQVELLEKHAPMWLGDVLLRNQVPIKDVVKISFVLEPWNGSLPAVASEGNNRLNANRMLRARKILSYVAERIEPASESGVLANVPAVPPTPTSVPVPATPTTNNFSSRNPYANYASPPPPSSSSTAEETNPFASPEDDEDHHLQQPSYTVSSSIASLPPQQRQQQQPQPLRPEDYLELYCNNQLVPPKMTLATIRSHFWRSGGDVVLVYRANGRKQILHAPPVVQQQMMMPPESYPAAQQGASVPRGGSISGGSDAGAGAAGAAAAGGAAVAAFASGINF